MAIRPNQIALFLAIGATLPSVSETVLAQSAGLEEIVVTAQKREESLQDTPIAVSAFTQQAIENRGIEDISDVANFTPNLVFDTTSPVSGLSSGAVVFIRGIGINDFALTTDPGVGVYIDGVYASRSVGGVLDVLDVERIEVLRGPQGTLFGRNTIGGALNITSRRPAEEFQGSVQVSAGNFDRADVRASIDIPFSDRFRSNFAVSSKNRDGFVERVLVGDELGNEDKRAFRANFVYQATDNLDIQLVLDRTEIDEASAGSVLVGITGNSPTAPATSTDGFNNIFVPVVAPSFGITGLPLFDQAFINDAEAGGDSTFGTGVSGTQLDVEGAGLTINWRGDRFEFKSITSLRTTEGAFFRDPDNSPIQITETLNPDYDHEQFTQEFQFTGTAFNDRLKYVAGVFFFEEEGTDNVFVPNFIPGAPALLNNFADVDNSSEALYSQLTWQATDQLALTVGGRYTEDQKEFVFTQFVGGIDGGPLPVPTSAVNQFGELVPGLLPLVGNGSGSIDDVFSETTFKAGIDYTLANDSLIYLSYSEGFKSGGFNLRYVEPRPEPLVFDPELARSLELGYKWQGWDNRLRINTAVFVTDYEDIQVTLFDAGGGPVTQNAGSADLSGLELELTALLTERFKLDVSYGFLDAAYDEISLPPVPLAVPINNDSSLANAPENKLNVGAEYEFSIGAGSAAVRADYSYTDDIFNDSQNSPFLFQEAYNEVNVSVRYESPNNVWNVRAFIDNLTDERFIESGDSNFGLGFHEANFNRPRQYGVSVKYNF